jgi:hypothetical protein
MKTGTKLKAQWTENITDHVTKDKVYEVLKVKDRNFWIINDKGEECFPISVTFTVID